MWAFGRRNNWNARKICNHDIHNLYCSPNVIKSKIILWMGNVSCKGYVRISCSILVRKPKGETGCST